MKTIIYVDGFNLYYRALKHTKFKWQDFPHEIPEGTRVRVTDRDNQIYVVKNGQWELEIAWTKCSEQMPPGDIEVIIDIDGILFHAYSIGPCTRRNINRHIAIAKWTPYTPEAWNSLNHKTD